MGKKTTDMKSPSGFTLVEMAVVLLILGLLMAGLLQPLANRMEQSRRQETMAAMEQIREALVGHALVNGRLPCPDTTGDGLEDSCDSNDDVVNAGTLPWATLGVTGTDAWGRSFLYAVNGAFTVAFDLDTEGENGGVLSVYASAGGNCSGGGAVADNVPAVVVSTAKTEAASSDEQENRDGDRCFVSRDYSRVSGAEFDDLVSWLPPGILFNRMVAAGRLP